MISPVYFYTGVKNIFASVSKNDKQKHTEIPAKSPIKEVPAKNLFLNNIKLIK